MESLKSYSSKTLYLFMKHDYAGNYLYGLDIRTPPEEEGVWEVRPPRLLHNFSPYPSLHPGMGCGKLGSKLYVLGGVTWSRDPCTARSVTVYPRDVQVFDPAEPKNLTQVEPMNYGKYHPIMFELNGKLYVLGSADESLRPVVPNMFEEYDPTTKQWKVLDDPPLGKSYSKITWASCSVVNPSRVIIRASEYDFEDIVFIFNPTTSKWSKLKLKPSVRRSFGSNPVFVDDSFYVADRQEAYIKIGPLPSSTLEDDEKLATAALSGQSPIMHWGDHMPSPRATVLPSTETDPLICHLGDGLFFLLRNSVAICDYGTERFLNVFIFKDLQTNRFCEGKCLHAATFTCAGILNASFTSCHVTSNDYGSLDSIEPPKAALKKNHGSLDSIEPPKVALEKDHNPFDANIVSEIDKTMNKYADNLLHLSGGVVSNLTQLQNRMQNLESSVHDLEVYIGNILRQEKQEEETESERYEQRCKKQEEETRSERHEQRRRQRVVTVMLRDGSFGDRDECGRNFKGQRGKRCTGHGSSSTDSLVVACASGCQDLKKRKI